ncbi:MAG TPA: sn-glycerol-3-phosphate ABC transporter ATP-binding protein UgpC [Candidatus Dormibacteraeota bacterium]|jgi:multiple sugar transport system ATP-binding protein|nr:sn-glycerol-3-phosphate ABC transporter ATP-binding protein UgpC [Candidatus Dormibacteraeota bacterium]
MSSVTYDHVVKRYTSDLTVVKDFNVEIKDKEFMVLVGPSGCGKSTALRMLAGLESISEGQIRIGDRVVNDVAAKDRDIAMVFQSYALYPHMSVYDNMAFPLQMQHMKKPDIDTRVKNASRILGLDNFLVRKPRALSGGQRQRVALGRAIVRNPKVFLLDEPLSNLDAKLRGQTRIELQKLHRDLETTFIYVTHDQVEAMTMGDRIAIMNAGILQQVGSPGEIYDHPANLFVAGFIGSPTMNFVPATVENGSAKASGFSVKLPKPIAATKGTLGFRPEAVTDRVTDEANSMQMKVDVVERLGSDQFLYGKVGSDAVTARVDPRMKVDPGDTVKLGLDTRTLHFFDAESELALL